MLYWILEWLIDRIVPEIIWSISLVDRIVPWGNLIDILVDLIQSTMMYG